MLDWMVNLIQYKIEYNCWFNANFAIYYRRLVSRRFFFIGIWRRVWRRRGNWFPIRTITISPTCAPMIPPMTTVDPRKPSPLGPEVSLSFLSFFFYFIFFHHSFKFKYHRVKTRYLEIKIELKELNMTLYSNMSDQWFWKMIEPTFNCEITFSSSPVLIYS